MALELAEAPATEVSRGPDFSHFIGESRALKRVLGTITSLLDNDSTVLVLGESGTGKELIARAIHFNSDRAANPLVIVNCGAIPEELLESELFGHEKGSFTGAIRTRVGKFELADKGTVFLDEIGDMSPTLQIKLLRVLQEQEFERVGGSRTIKVNVRVIAATHKNLEKAIEEGKFREDLYYRLNVIPIEAPPLRERGEDINMLITHFIRLFNRIKKRSITGITPETMALLRAYTWPGNIRELEHLIERLVVLKGSGVIESTDLPHKFRALEPSADDQLSRDMALVGGVEEDLPVEKRPIPANRPALNEPSPLDDSSADEGAALFGGVEIDTRPLAETLAVTPALPMDGINLKEAVDAFKIFREEAA
ncbi:MAG: sigma 54-interacting transcriptional regulator [Nitrospinae bacterium]|nr:sigma 54-interacting transcriptional regulator [Nitrospinota bacterium]